MKLRGQGCRGTGTNSSSSDEGQFWVSPVSSQPTRGNLWKFKTWFPHLENGIRIFVS